jgi:Holliday junction resolvase
MNANQKGKRFELKIAKDLAKKFDSNIRRTPNSGGLSIKGDIMTTTGILSEYSWECKNQEKLNIWKALEQSQGDARGTLKIPLVVFTKNFENDYVALKYDDFVNLLIELDELRNSK